MRGLVLIALLFAACATNKPAPQPYAPLAQNEPTAQYKQPQNNRIGSHVAALRTRLKHGHCDAIQFIETHAATVQLVSRAYDITPEIMLAVAMHESGFGRSNIAQCANLHGIKAGDGWHGEVYIAGDGAAYRVFGDASAAFVGFADYVCERLPFFVGRDITAAEFAHSYGCARPKQYAKKINTIIARYGLKTLFEND